MRSVKLRLGAYSTEASVAVGDCVLPELKRRKSRRRVQSEEAGRTVNWEGQLKEEDPRSAAGREP